MTTHPTLLATIAAFVIAATAGVDAPTADTGSGAAALATAERLETDCAATTGQLIWLQHWTRKVCK